ncbi:MAG: hypothetical protein J7647_18900, partial [Cyanobacteria bacterium SBLK]|nr:hypothetical protein [Cyanobacteria bacterium SBLK]
MLKQLSTKLKDKIHQIFRTVILESNLTHSKQLTPDEIKTLPNLDRISPQMRSTANPSIDNLSAVLESGDLPANGDESHPKSAIFSRERDRLNPEGIEDTLSRSEGSSSVTRDSLTGLILSEPHPKGYPIKYQEIQKLLSREGKITHEVVATSDDSDPQYDFPWHPNHKNSLPAIAIEAESQSRAMADETMQGELETDANRGANADANSTIALIDEASLPVETAIASKVTLPNSIGVKYPMKSSSKWGKNHKIPDALKYAIARATNLESYAWNDLEQTNEWMFYLTPNQSPESVALFLGAEYAGEGNFIPDTHLFKFSEDFDLSEFLLRLEALEERIKYVQPLVSTSLTSQQFSFADQWHLSNTGQTGGTIGVDINVVDAWDLGYSGEDIVVAVVDDGIKVHPALIYETDGVTQRYREDLDR